MKKMNYSEIRELHNQNLEVLLHEIHLNTHHHQFFSQMNIEAEPENFHTSDGSPKRHQKYVALLTELESCGRIKNKRITWEQLTLICDLFQRFSDHHKTIRKKFNLSNSSYYRIINKFLYSTDNLEARMERSSRKDALTPTEKNFIEKFVQPPAILLTIIDI